MRPVILYFIYVAFPLISYAQTADWRAMLIRSDGVVIPFEMQSEKKRTNTTWTVINGDERIELENLHAAGDSLILEFPVYESQFRLRVHDDVITGTWVKAGIESASLQMPIVMVKDMPRFSQAQQAKVKIDGTWSAIFPFRDTTTVGYAGIFEQQDEKLTGTFLTPYGDYRFLRGQVSNDTLYLSGFNGVQPTLFIAPVDPVNTITKGKFYYADNPVQEWTGLKQESVAVDYASSAGVVREGAGTMNFRFRNTDSEWVALDADRYKNKVIIIQILGTWCPNCLDETAFLTEYYKLKPADVEIIGLAYEYSTDWERSTRSLKKLEERYQVPYEILNTEVRVGDPQMTEKTLPGISRIGSFPTTIYLDKQHRVAYIETAFNGPATGEHHEIYKREFIEKIELLRKKPGF